MVSTLRPIKGVKLRNGVMSKTDFCNIQKALKLTNKEMAAELELSLRMIQSMRSGERKIVPSTAKLMRFIAKENGFTF